MKLKIVCLLIVLFGCSLAASPNRNCGGVRCAGKLTRQVTTMPVKKVIMMIDEVELLPMHHLLNNF